MRRGLSRHSNKSSGNFFSPIALFAGGVNGVWYDPSDSATLFSDTAGTTPSPTPGAGALSVVGKMLDKSGNGNHAISYNTTTARPELSARVNLLTYSEDQSNGVWNNYNATQQSNVGIAPDGTNTADRIIETSGAAPQARYQSIGAGLSIQYTVSAYAKAGERSVFNLSYSGTAGANWFAATFDLTGNGQVTKTGAGASGTYTSSSITPVGNGWYCCQVTGNTNQVSGHFVYGGPSDTTNPTYGSFGVPTYTGNTSNGVLVWGFDVRPANIGTSVPAYQRIADQYTYDSSGFPRYLVFNGTASGMYTPASIPFATVTSDGQTRRNLLNNPTQFDVTASWTPTALTVTANAIVAPDGTTTADTITGDGTVATHWITQSQSASATGKVFSVYAKAGTNNFIQLLFAGDANPWANFDLSNGTVGSVGTSVTAAISDAGNGWYRCSASTSSASASSVFVNLVNASTAPRGQSIALSTSAYLWGAQAESGTTLTAFQNIGTDKATVFAGVRKLSGTTGVISELSADTQTNAGSFVLGSAFVSAASYDVQVRGSARNARYYETYTAPISNVLSSQMTTAAADSATAAQTRVNGAVTSGLSFLSAASTGNFGTYALNIGVRSAAATPSLYFNGYIYSLIVVGAASTAAQISSTESWINVKEGTVY